MSNIPITGVPTHEEKNDKQEEIIQMIKEHFSELQETDFPGGLVAKTLCSQCRWPRLCAPNAGGLGSILCQGTRFHMQIPNATTKTQHRQI